MESETQVEYRVVVNQEGQYSIWPSYKERPRGWDDAGKRGPKEDCLAFIEQVWTDMRPRSLREHKPSSDLPEAEQHRAHVGPSLLDRLCAGRHAICVGRASNALELQEQLQRQYVHLVFTSTDGPTELSVRPDPTATDATGASFDEGRGVLRIAGNLQVDFESVRLIAEIDLSTLCGAGGLIRANGAHC